MLAFLKAAEHLPLRADEQIEPTYRRLRWQIFVGIFVGYAGFYLVRLNFNLAMPYVVDQGYSRGAVGFALSGVSIAYGLSKFLMGSVSDRSNARLVLPSGLVVSGTVNGSVGLRGWRRPD